MQPPTEIPADRLLSAINAWLWENEDPPPWASWGLDASDVRAMIDCLNKRPDAASETVQAAIAECWFFFEQPWA